METDGDKDCDVCWYFVYVLKGCPEWRLCRSAIVGELKFMERLVELVKVVAREGVNRKKKVRFTVLYDQLCIDVIQ
jgi:hypothetical protein